MRAFRVGIGTCHGHGLFFAVPTLVLAIKRDVEDLSHCFFELLHGNLATSDLGLGLANGFEWVADPLLPCFFNARQSQGYVLVLSAFVGFVGLYELVLVQDSTQHCAEVDRLRFVLQTLVDHGRHRRLHVVRLIVASNKCRGEAERVFEGLAGG